MCKYVCSCTRTCAIGSSLWGWKLIIFLVCSTARNPCLSQSWLSVTWPKYPLDYVISSWYHFAMCAAAWQHSPYHWRKRRPLDALRSNVGSKPKAVRVPCPALVLPPFHSVWISTVLVQEEKLPGVLCKRACVSRDLKRWAWSCGSRLLWGVCVSERGERGVWHMCTQAGDRGGCGCFLLSSSCLLLASCLETVSLDLGIGW